MSTAPTKRVDINELETAKFTWEKFHAKSYKRIRHVDVAWPDRWYKIGHVTHVYYRSDKWQPDGDFVDYYHEHGPKVTLWFCEEALEADELFYCPRCGSRIDDMVESDAGGTFKPCGHTVSHKMLRVLIEEGAAGSSARPGRPPVDFPTTGAVLGKSLGFDTETACYGEGKGDLLCTDAAGKFLFLVDSDGSPWAIIEGPSLQVKAEGIVG